MLFLNWRDTRNPEGGGSEVYVESVARALAAAGHEITVFCAAHEHGAPDEVVDGVRFIRAGTKLTVYQHGLRRLRKRAFGGLDVIVDVQNGIPFMSPLAAGDVPVMVLVHHVHREQWPVVYGPVRSRIGWAIESRLAPRVYRGRQYVAVSETTKSELVELGVRSDDIEVVYNGLQHADVGMDADAVAQDANPRVLVLGRVVPHKQVEHVIDAAAKLRSSLPGLTVAVVGDGWWLPKLQEHARNCGVADMVEFLGFVDEREKRRQLSRAWALAMPSLKEGWGLVVMEAAQYGLPAVGYRSAGGVAESIVDNETGILVDGEQDDFAAMLGQLMTDAPLRLRMGAAARVRSHEFGWDQTASRFADVLALVAGTSPIEVREPEPVQVQHEDPQEQVGAGLIPQQSHITPEIQRGPGPKPPKLPAQPDRPAETESRTKT